MEPAEQIYEFGRFRLDASRRLFLRDGEPMPLMPKAFDTLLLLVENSGRTLEKNELMEQIWPDTVVEENNLSVNISALRKALGESAAEPQFILTFPGRGYRFVANVKRSSGQGASLIIEEHLRTNIVIEKDGSLESSEKSKSAAVLLSPQHNLNRKVFNVNRRVLAAGVVLLLLGLGLYVWINRGTNNRNASGRIDAPLEVKSIAILPFKPISSGLDENYLGLGMADALITKLSNVKQLIVRPTSAVARYTSPGQDSIIVGRDLKVDAVLDGSIQIVGDNLRVTLQLLRVSDGRPLWGEKFDEKFSDLFMVQDSISERVATALTSHLSTEERERLNKRHTNNVEAYELYLKGRYFWNKFSPDAIQKSIDYYGKALDLDPNFALAHAGLADAYNVLGVNYLSPQENFPKAKAAAENALRLDEHLAEAHAALGAFYLHYDWNWSASELELKRAMELNPNYPIAHELYGYYLRTIGNLEGSLNQAEQAISLDPLSPLFGADLANAYFALRQYDKSIDAANKALEIDPNFIPALGILAQSHEQKGMNTEAVADLHRMIGVIGRDPFLLGVLAHVYANSGKRNEAYKILAEMKQKTEKTFVSPYAVAIVHVGLDEKDQAFAWLEKAFEVRDTSLVLIKVDPVLNPLRGDPRFAALLQRMNL